MVLVVAGLLLTGCASTTPSPRVTVTATPSAAFSVIIFNPVTSGKDLATRIAARAKLKTATDTITNVERKNFANITVGTHTDCQMQVNGVKRGFRATFTQSDGGTWPERRQRAMTRWDLSDVGLQPAELWAWTTNR